MSTVEYQGPLRAAPLALHSRMPVWSLGFPLPPRRPISTPWDEKENRLSSEPLHAFEDTRLVWWKTSNTATGLREGANNKMAFFSIFFFLYIKWLMPYLFLNNSLRYNTHTVKMYFFKSIQFNSFLVPSRSRATIPNVEFQNTSITPE